MEKTTLQTTCDYFGINKKALKECLKERGIKAKYATEREVLEVIFIYSTDLFYCRNAGDGMLEYLDKEVPFKLSTALAKAV